MSSFIRSWLFTQGFRESCQGLKISCPNPVFCLIFKPIKPFLGWKFLFPVYTLNVFIQPFYLFLLIKIHLRAFSSTLQYFYTQGTRPRLEILISTLSAYVSIYISKRFLRKHQRVLVAIVVVVFVFQGNRNVTPRDQEERAMWSYFHV